ncbi:MAG: T9SS C-terminal target domain-containing protein [Bacteroidetes bacterium]|nr:MAG: T9SS C-terminal target domain-containing protein [Bacteroidota bacterium]
MLSSYDFEMNPAGDKLFGAEGFALDGGVYYSTNYGRSWQPTSLEDEYVFTIEFLPNGMLLAGTKEGVFISADEGDNWEQANEGLPSRTEVFSFLYRETDNMLFIGSNKGIYYSKDQGESWTAANLPQYVWVYTLFEGGNGKILAGTSQGMFRSTDQGMNWVSVAPVFFDLAVNELLKLDKDNWMACTSDGVFFSSDQGNNWVASSRGLTTFGIGSLAVHPVTGAIFVGTSKGLFRSEDGGQNWQRVSREVVGFDYGSVRAMYILPNGDMLAASTYDIFRSTDGGNSWRELDFFGEDVWDFVYDTSRGALFAAAGQNRRGGVYYSNDGGISWVLRGLGGLYVYELELTADGKLYALTRDGIFRSADSGTSWEEVPTAFPSGTYVYTLHALADGQKLLAGTSKGIYISEDGQSWTGTQAPSTSVASLLSTADGHIFAATEVGLYVSENGGMGWTPHNSGLTDRRLGKMIVGPDGYLYAGSYSGKVFRSREAVQTLTATDPKAKGEEVILGQNYPNPFKTSTQISFELPSAGPVVLDIHTVQGKVVRRLLDQPLAAGKHVVSWDGRDEHARLLPTGTYFYRLQAGSFSATRPMVLLK